MLRRLSRYGGARDALVHMLSKLDPTKQRAITALAIRVVGAGLAYLMQILLARWMGLAEYGVFVGVWVWLLVLGGIAPLGLNITVIGLLSTFHERADHAQSRGLMATSILVPSAAGLVIGGSGWLTLWLVPSIVSDPYLVPILLSLVCVPLLALCDVNEGIARAHGWMNTALLPTYLLRPALLIVGTFTAVQWGMTVDARLVMSVAIGACLLTVLAQGVVLTCRLRRPDNRRQVAGSPLIWIVASLPIVFAQTFELITQNFDMIAVSYFLGPESAGVYFAALKTITLLTYVNFAVGAATANRVAALHALESSKDLRSVMGGAVNLAFWPTLIGAGVLVSIAPWLLSFFGEDFASQSGLAAVLAIGFVAKSAVGPAELYLNVLGQQRICAVVLMLAAALNMALNIVLIPVYGLMGAAIATATALVLLSIALFLVTWARIGVVLRPSVPLTTVRALMSRA